MVYVESTSWVSVNPQHSPEVGPLDVAEKELQLLVVPPRVWIKLRTEDIPTEVGQT